MKCISIGQSFLKPLVLYPGCTLESPKALKNTGAWVPSPEIHVQMARSVDWDSFFKPLPGDSDVQPGLRLRTALDFPVAPHSGLNFNITALPDQPNSNGTNTPRQALSMPRLCFLVLNSFTVRHITYSFV